MSMYLGNIIAAVIGIPFVVRLGLPNGNSLFFLLIAGILSALTYTLYAKASTKLTALEAVLLPIIDPVMNPVWVFLTLGERPGALSLIGAAVVLTAVTVRVLIDIRSSPET